MRAAALLLLAAAATVQEPAMADTLAIVRHQSTAILSEREIITHQIISLYHGISLWIVGLNVHDRICFNVNDRVFITDQWIWWSIRN